MLARALLLAASVHGANLDLTSNVVELTTNNFAKTSEGLWLLEFCAASPSLQIKLFHHKVVFKNKLLYRAWVRLACQCPKICKLAFQEDIAKHGSPNLCQHICVSNSTVVCWSYPQDCSYTSCMKPIKFFPGSLDKPDGLESVK